MKVRILIALTMALLTLAGSARAAESPEAAAARADLARRLGVPVAEIRVAAEREVTFPDGSLGLPRPGEMTTQALVEGVALTLQSGNAAHLYTGASGRVRYGGPRSAWSYSALWIEPVENDPNLNGNLVQVSLAGTNPDLLLSGVGDFWPRPDGSVLATRRTSRSGHDLLYLAPGQRREARKLLSGFAFACPTTDSTGRIWAAFLRPQVGGGWVLLRQPLSGDTEPERLALPEGTRPLGLSWTGQEPVITVDRQGTPRNYEWTGKAWQELASWIPPEADLMMNKSEHLEVRTVTEGGTPVTKVLSVWFTGDERVLATIPDFEYREMNVAPGFEFLVLSGGGKAYAVDVFSGQALPLPASSTAPTRLLLTPPPAWAKLEGWFKP